MEVLELVVDVTDTVDLGETATIALTVHMPSRDRLPDRPVVCFATPGGGFGRRYYTTDLPGPGTGAQARWHVERGWIFVSVDHLGTGDSSTHSLEATSYQTVAAAANAAERAVLGRLADGTLGDAVGIVKDPVVIGLGQSLGGCLTIVQQAHHHTFDGIAILGYGVTHSRVPGPPGAAPIVQRWRTREPSDVVLNARQFAASTADIFRESSWCFYYDDVDLGVVRHGDRTSPWSSSTYPGPVRSALTPGVVASEAAAVEVPVLIAVGERDVVVDPIGEARAYISSRSIDCFVCPRMGHMHNFAGTRALLWERIDTWAAWVAAQRAELRT